MKIALDIEPSKDEGILHGNHFDADVFSLWFDENRLSTDRPKCELRLNMNMRHRTQLFTTLLWAMKEDMSTKEIKDLVAEVLGEVSESGTAL